MAAKRGEDFFKSQAFTQSLRVLLDSLPTEAQSQEITAQLDGLIRFLDELKERLRAVPSKDDARAAIDAVERLDTWFATAKGNPVVAALVGVKPRAPRPRAAPFSSEDAERARATIARFDTLPIDEIRAALTRMTSRELQGVASAMGVRTNRRTTHDVVAQQIATKITNARGYRSLRDGTDERAPAGDKENK